MRGFPNNTALSTSMKTLNQSAVHLLSLSILYNGAIWGHSSQRSSIRGVSGRVRTEVGSLKKELKDQSVFIQARVQLILTVDKKTAFVIIREGYYSVQCVVMVTPDLVSTEMLKYATAITKESYVEIEGIVTVPPDAIIVASQQVEIIVRKIFTINRAPNVLPISIVDARRSEFEIEKALEAGKQDTRLNYKYFEMQTPTIHGVFRLLSRAKNSVSKFLLNEDFEELFTPKITECTGKDGADVFKLNCIGQSPLLYKQMFNRTDFEGIFVAGPVFRHSGQFTGLYVEMVIKEHYSEVMDIVGRLFVKMFDKLNKKCRKELEVIGRQYPFKPLKYLRNTLRLTYEEGIQMLKEAGFEVIPVYGLTKELKRTLGELVFEKYGTEFYVLYRYPLAIRAFYTMPCPDNMAYGNSFDVFLRGEEIISGGQRVHVPELFEARATTVGVGYKEIASYMDSFRYGALPPHGGFGVELERIVKLFCGIDDVCKHRFSLVSHEG